MLGAVRNRCSAVKVTVVWMAEGVIDESHLFISRAARIIIRRHIGETPGLRWKGRGLLLQGSNGILGKFTATREAGYDDIAVTERLKTGGVDAKCLGAVQRAYLIYWTI